MTMALAKIAIKPQGLNMQVTATQAKNRFGAICAQAKTEPVFVEKDGRIDTVILSAKQFSELQASKNTETLTQRKAQFEQSHGAWLAEQNQRFESHGLWCDDMRVW
ncbi:type II toxin-antitoxin system Phd/YefM family antitoxin [Limnohabitans sp. JirII-31]|uniref:type II toxin-antitoxin system Phd/YefM family antitoxin n=2 Tax=unclassified Limnohabitans TaxID=2626134 RepID=UPI001E4494A0|nr:type II toxin-antitoxin system Phd/YefM family antitoxin [Limnohabitans sp. JirII-31]